MAFLGNTFQHSTLVEAFQLYLQPVRLLRISRIKLNVKSFGKEKALMQASNPSELPTLATRYHSRQNEELIKIRYIG